MKRFNLMSKNPPASKSRDIELIVVLLPIILSLTLVYFLHVQKQPEFRKVNPVLINKLNSLKREYENLVSISTSRIDMSKLIEERNRLRNNLAAIKSLGVAKAVPLELLVSIGRSISDKLALTVINKTEETVLLEGIAQDNKSLSDFMDLLIDQNVFKDVGIKMSQYSDEFGPYKQKFTIVGML